MPARVGLVLRRHMCGEAIESDVMSTKRGSESPAGQDWEQGTLDTKAL